MKKTIITLSLCCVTLFSMLIYQSLSMPTVSASNTLTTEEQTNPMYLIRANDGMLAIYPYGSNTALEITDIRLSSLREYDQHLIERGFPLYSERDLATFLEDFGS